jgi:hypothetical protein
MPKPTLRKPANRSITLDLHDHEAMALAQLCKRITRNELNTLSTGTAEHTAMDSRAYAA